MRVLAHFVPGEKVLEFLAPEADWLDIRWCADDDSPESQTSFYKELPGAEVIWHVLRPLSGEDLRRGGPCGAFPLVERPGYAEAECVMNP